MKFLIVVAIALVIYVSAEETQDKKEKHGLYNLGYQGGLENYDDQNLGHEFQNYRHDQFKHQGAKVETYLRQEFKVAIPRPYPVHVEKKVPVPYPVEVKVPVGNPVPVYVIKPYPVPVQKQIPYPVEENIPVPVKVPVIVPYAIKVAVPIEKPYPVQVTKNVPYIVRQPVYVEKQIPFYVTDQQYQDEGYGQVESESEYGQNSGNSYAGH